MINIYKIKPDAIKEVKKVLENPDVAANKWARNGYTLRDSKSLGVEEDCYYLYVNADEEFFNQNEEQIMIEGVEKLQGEEYEKIKNLIEEEQSGAAAGIGAIFG